MSVQKKSDINKIKTIRSENRFRVYSNHTGLEASNFDIRLTFAEIESSDGSAITVIEHGTVTMSPQHAKAFSANFAQAVRQFESLYGAIEMPKKESVK